MGKGILRLAIGLLVAAFIAMTLGFFNTTTELGEVKEELNKSITGESADILFRKNALERVIADKAQEGLDVDILINILKEEKAKISSDMEENIIIHKGLEKAAKDSLGLN